MTTRELRHSLYIRGVQNETVYVDAGDSFVYTIQEVIEEDGHVLLKTYKQSLVVVVDPSAQLDPLNSMVDRATVAEDMLDQYHVAKVNFAIRESMYNRFVERYGLTHEQTEVARGQLKEAEVALDAVKYEILELMGVDS